MVTLLPMFEADAGSEVGRAVADNVLVSKVGAPERLSTTVAAKWSANLVHELRTPLNAILTWAQLLAAGAADPELKRGLDAIVRSARVQARLLDGVDRPVQGQDADAYADDLALPSPVDETAADAGEPFPDLTGVRVLVVDDDDDLRAATMRTVVAAGATVIAASSVSSALDCLRRHRVDIILSDITMPGPDGYALMTAVRAASSVTIRTTPAIALTGLASSHDRRRAYRAGFQMHLAKPFDPVELCLVVATLSAASVRRRPVTRSRPGAGVAARS